MLRLAWLEIRKMKRRYGKLSLTILAITVIFSACVGYFTVVTGVTSDHSLYTSNVEVNSSTFVVSQNPDISVSGNVVFVHRSDKSLAAADEFRTVIMAEYRKKIEERYGDLAYPLMVSVKYVKIGGAGVVGVNRSVNESAGKVGKATATNTPVEKAPSENRTNYIPPEDLKTPSLVDRMATAFIFVIPAYFTVQVFSSSLLEDKMLRRLEVLLSAVGRREILTGKILPYLAVSTIFAVAVSLVSGNPAACVFALPVILLLFAAHSFVVVIARSYREATFLLLVASLLITIYAFIPAIFSTAIPLSKISPVTLLLTYLNRDTIDPVDVLVSFGHFGVMTGLLLYMSAKGLNPDVLHGKSIAEKVVEISRLCIKSDVSAFVFAFLSISFAFMAELFALLALFILPQYLLIPALLLSVALVEELIKSSIILSKPDEKRALATALGFFTGEKFLVMFNILQQYSIAFLGQYLVLPLVLHITTALLFVVVLKRCRVATALVVAISVHAVYDCAVVMLLA